MKDIIVTPKNWELFLKEKKNGGGIKDEDIETVGAAIRCLEEELKHLKRKLVKLYKRIDTMGGGMDSTLFKIDENFIIEILEILFHAKIINQDIIDVHDSGTNTGYKMDFIKEKSKKIDAVIKKMDRIQF